jgi:hypothetical protein
MRQYYLRSRLARLEKVAFAYYADCTKADFVALLNTIDRLSAHKMDGDATAQCEIEALVAAMQRGPE